MPMNPWNKERWMQEQHMRGKVIRTKKAKVAAWEEGQANEHADFSVRGWIGKASLAWILCKGN